MKNILSWAPTLKTLLSASLIVLSFQPYDLSFLIWIALVPWLSEVSQARDWKEALRHGFWLSALMTLFGFHWIAYAMHEFGAVPWGLSALALFLFSFFAQPQFPLFALLWHRATALPLRSWKGAHSSIALALLYVGVDWILPKLFKDTLGHSLYNASNLRQVADIGGASLLTLVVVFINQTFFSMWRLFRLKREPSAWPTLAACFPQGLIALVLFVSCLAYGVFRNKAVQQILAAPRGHLQAAVIQANIGDFDKIAAEQGVRGAAEKVMTTFFRMSDQALTLTPRPEVIIWPETSYPSTFRTPQTATEFARDLSVENYVKTRGVPLLFGGYDQEGGKDFNAFFFLNPTPTKELPGEDDLQTYRKSILLLFGEYIPGAEWFPAIKRAFPQIGYFGKGPGPRVFPIFLKDSKKIPVNPLICYEALFPNFILDAVRKGSEIILNITNDSWFGPYGEPHSHLALSTFRSIEARKAQIRSTNTGFSGLILPDGSIEAKSDLFAPAILNLKVPLLLPMPTRMLAWGDWFGWVALVLGGALALFLFFARSRKAERNP